MTLVGASAIERPAFWDAISNLPRGLRVYGVVPFAGAVIVMSLWSLFHTLHVSERQLAETGRAPLHLIVLAVVIAAVAMGVAAAAIGVALARRHTTFLDASEFGSGPGRPWIGEREFDLCYDGYATPHGEYAPPGYEEASVTPNHLDGLVVLIDGRPHRLSVRHEVTARPVAADASPNEGVSSNPLDTL